MILLFTFFGCRICWGNYQSFCVFKDVYSTLTWHGSLSHHSDVHNATYPSSAIFKPRDGQLCLNDPSCIAAQFEVMKFASPATRETPLWLAAVYLGCNLVLNSLNIFWFGKMIETVRKRFQGKPHAELKGETDGGKGRETERSIVEEAATELDREVLSGPKTPYEERVEEKAFGMTSGMDKEMKVNRRRNDG